MYLNPKRWLVRYTYSLSALDPGHDLWRTTLCGFFWRFVFTTLGWIVILLFLSLVIHLIIFNPLTALGIVVGAVSLICLCVAVDMILDYLAEWRYRRETVLLEGSEPSASNVLLQGLKALKQHFCPIITFKEE